MIEGSFSDWPQHGSPDGIIRFDYRSPVDGLNDWALIRPGHDRLLWVVNLHGHGSQADQLFTRRDIRDGFLPVFEDFGVSLFTPNLRDNAWMSPVAVADLHALLSDIRLRFGARRFMLVSGSMGGTGSLIYAIRHPGDVDALLALCPATDLAAYVDWLREHPGDVRQSILAAILDAYGGDPQSRMALYAAHCTLAHANRLQMPIGISHGEADALIPIAHTLWLQDALSRHPDSFFRILPGGGHDAPLHDPATLDWLRQTLQKQKESLHDL